jgi:hypothetical protein
MLHTKALDSSTPENCDPDLRGFIDSVIVPMLVREYITRHGSGIDIARPTRAVPQFQSDTKLSAERIPR